LARFRKWPFSFLGRARRKSAWIIPLCNGSCGGCGAELEAAFAPRFDAARLGMRLTGSPKHADVVVVTGVLTEAMKEPLLRTIKLVPQPSVVVALGDCACNGEPFIGSYAVAGIPGDFIPVDIVVHGCAPRPQAIIDGLLQAAKLLESASASGGRPSPEKELADRHDQQEDDATGPSDAADAEADFPSEGLEAHSH
jgi:membrane-bound hydrogenase subunit mbhJ